jgi:hypothetical protein
MNYKFSIKIAALLATFTGTAIGPTSLLPPEWLASAHAQPPIVSPDQADPSASSNMLAPIGPPVVKPGEAMPWKVDKSKYQSAISPSARVRPGLVQPAKTRTNTAPAPTVKHAGGLAHEATATAVQPAAAQMTAPVQGKVPSGFSAGGVPLYSSVNSAHRATGNSTPQPPQTRVASRAGMQGSGTRNAIGSGVQSAPMAIDTLPSGEFMAPSGMPAPPVISPGSEMIIGDAPGVMMDNQPAPMSSVISDGTVAVPAPVYSDAGVVTEGVISDGTCDTCNASGAMGCDSCGGCNCGPDGCFNAADIASKAGLYGSVGEARYYSHLEVMLMDRQDGDVIFTPSLRLGGFDSDYGYRITLGERFDAINGREISYWGTGQISNSATLDGAGTFPLDQVFETTDSTRTIIAPFGYFADRTPTFLVRPTQQSHSKETYFHTVELNRVRWAWDVFKSFAGLRYIYVNDSYQLNSTASRIGLNAPAGPFGTTSGVYKNLAQNNLIGPHIGAEWFYDVGYRLSASVNLKGGIYANLNEVDTRLITDGVANINSDSESTAFSSSLEFGIHAHYQIAPRGRLRAGFNVLHLEDVATVTQNFPPFVNDIDGTSVVRSISRGTGTGSFDDDDLTFTGFSFGFEFFR